MSGGQCFWCRRAHYFIASFVMYLFHQANSEAHCETKVIVTNAVTVLEAASFQDRNQEILIMQQVLVVDDSNAIRQLLSRTLSSSGYEVSSAEDGLKGLELAKKRSFDLVITDINMPEMDGLSLIVELRELPDYQLKPILVLSTEHTREMKQKGKEAGATGWLVKPFNPTSILEIVSKVLPEQEVLAEPKVTPENTQVTH